MIDVQNTSTETNSPLYCTLCRKRLPSPEALKRHDLLKHGPDMCQFPCDQCSSKLSTKGHLEKHKLGLHNPENPSSIYDCIFCEKIFSGSAGATNDKRNLQSHLLTHTKEKPCWCPLCGWEASSHSEMLAHIQYHTGEKPVRCNWKDCHRSFANQGAMKMHILSYHRLTKTKKNSKAAAHVPPESTGFRCDICQKFVSSKNTLRSHMQTSHRNQRKFTCTICGQGFNNPTWFSRHQTAHRQGQFYCNICQIQYKSRAKLRLHMKSAHEPNRPCFKCDMCSKSYPAFYTLQRHIKLAHVAERPYKCHLCDHTSVLKFAMTKHILTHQKKIKEPKYACRICEEKLHTKLALRAHSKVHHAHRAFKCNLCPKDFKTFGDLRQHKKRRHNAARIHCVFCRMPFQDYNTMNYHIRIHIGEKAYPCPECEQWCLTRAHLKGHLERTHNSTKFHCDQCPFKCVQSATLAKHQAKFHSVGGAEKLGYTCLFCEKWFRTEYAGFGHMNIHTGEKPYPCLLCSKTFASYFKMRAHLQCHTGEKPHKCPWEGCTMAFQMPRSVKTHLKMQMGTKPYKYDL